MTEITPENTNFFMRQALAFAERAQPPSVAEAFPAKGTLRVQVSVADGAFPVANAVVAVLAGETVLYRVETDSSGIAEGITLPARDRALSGAENTAAQSGAAYTVTVEHDGFLPVTREIEIYADTESLLPVELIPTEWGNA